MQKLQNILAVEETFDRYVLQEPSLKATSLFLNEVISEDDDETNLNICVLDPPDDGILLY